MTEARIVLLERGQSIGDEYREADGTISIPVSVKIALNIKERELTKFERLISDFTNSFTQEVDKEGQYKLEYVHHKRHKRNSSRYRGYLLVDNIKLLDGFIIVTKSEEKPINGKVRYTFQIIGTHQQWKEGSRILKACDIKAQKEDVLWTEETILDTWQNNAPYRRGGDTFYPLLANFGKYLNQIKTGLEEDPEAAPTGEVSVNDIRVLNYITPLIKEGYCQLGYEVKSRFLESDYARRQAGYHLGETYAKNSIKDYNYLFRAKGKTEKDDGHYGGDFDNPSVMRLGDTTTAPCFDKGETYQEDNLVFNRPFAFVNRTKGMVKYRFHYDLLVLAVAPPNPSTTRPRGTVFIEALIGRASDPASEPPIIQLPVASTTGVSGFSLEGHFDINVPAGYYVQLAWYDEKESNPSTGALVTYMGESEWWNERLSDVWLNGDTVDINKAIDEDLTFEDILFDTGILFNWRFKTTESTKTVEFEPSPAEYRVWEVPVEDFLTLRGFRGLQTDERGYIDLTKEVNLLEWIEKDLREQLKPKAYLVKFKNHSDKYDAYQEFTEERPPLSSRTEIEGGTEKEVTITLKKYEPTLSAQDSTLQQNGGIAPFVPFMWGKERDDKGQPPEPSNKIGYRILCVLGWVKQYANEDSVAARFLFEGIEYEFIPTTNQYYPLWYAPTDGDVRRKTQLNNIFGSSDVENELITSVYGSDIESEREAIDQYFKVQMSTLQIHCWQEGMLMRLMYENSQHERFNGFYQIREISKTVNTTEDATLRVRYIGGGKDCISEATPNIEEDICNLEELLPTARLWVDATDIKADGSAVIDGTLVNRWHDKSNEGNDLVNIGTQSVPVKFTSGGREVVEFTGDQLQTSTPLPLTSYLYIFLVSRTRLVSGEGVTISFQEEKANGTKHTDEWSIPDANNNLKWISRDNPTQTVPWGTNTDDYNIYLLRHARWSSGIQEDLFNRNSVDLGGYGFGNIVRTEEIIVGRSIEGGKHQNINIAELLIFSRPTNEVETGCIMDYLSDKWNIPLE